MTKVGHMVVVGSEEDRRERGLGLSERHTVGKKVRKDGTKGESDEGTEKETRKGKGKWKEMVGKRER